MNTLRLLLVAAVVAVPFAGSASACGPRTLILCAVRAKACETVDPHLALCGSAR